MAQAAAPRLFSDLDDLSTAVGCHIGTSEWFEITQERIDRFAAATNDEQWIHVNVARATAESPYGATIAHGFLTLSLVAPVLTSVVDVATRKAGINYGCDRVRFITAVPAGSRLRGHVTLSEMDRTAPDAARLHYDVTMQLEHAPKPAAVVRAIVVLMTE